MKKLLVLLLTSILFYSCLAGPIDSVDFRYENIPITEAIFPANFTFGQEAFITLKYTLPDSCYSFDRVSSETEDGTIIIAITTEVALDKACAEVAVEGEEKISIIPNQNQIREYTFKLFKGTNSNGENVFEEVVISVI